MRKLVTLRNIDDIKPIEGADNIEQIVIDGWSLVCQKGIHSIGDQVLYFEIDSFLPQSDSRFESFMKFGIRTFNEVTGHRVRTIKLRGCYSQGVVMPVSEFPEIISPAYDTDYSELIGIVKWEKLDVGYSGDQKGGFPGFLQKSDQERIQNIYKSLDHKKDSEFVGTLKMDGSSITVFCVVEDKHIKVPRIGICSRNLELKLSEPTTPLQDRGKFEIGAINSDICSKVFDMFIDTGRQLAIQGELVGPGIQGNFEKFDTYEVFAYNIFDIDKQEFVSYSEFINLCEDYDIKHVPEIYPRVDILNSSIEDILTLADGPGLRASYREGIVWKEIYGKTQFKAISNRYLAKEKD